MNSQTKAAGTGIRAAGETTHCKPNYTPETLPLVVVKDVARVDSRIIAESLGKQHESVMRLLTDFAADFEQFGTLTVRSCAVEFSDLKSGKSMRGRPERSAMLNEDQVYLLLTFSRNTRRVRDLKIKLVQAFRRARDGMETGKDYLPFYHQLQDVVKLLAQAAQKAGSTTGERMFHININRMVNTALGLQSGERDSLTPQKRMAVTASCVIAQKAIESALKAGCDHHIAYAEAKLQVERYAMGAAPLLEAA